MKSVFVTVLALAASVLATNPDKHPGHPENPPVTTLTTFTTTTVCPITSTKTQSGVTSIITTTTTSTIVVTSCVGGCGVAATVTAPPTYSTKTDEVYQTITSLCPVTETKTVGGSVIVSTYTSTSLIVAVVPTTIAQYTTLPAVTKSIETFVYQTSTSLCPITEVQTVAGTPVTVVFTSTSLVIVKVPTTIVEHTTALTTLYATTGVFTTKSEFETLYTTVSAGSTVVITQTLTSTIKVTSAYTVTQTLEPPTTKATVFVPITLATSVAYTEVVTIPSEKTSTAAGGTVYQTVSVPQTSTFVPPPVVVTPSPTTVLTTAPLPTTAPPATTPPTATTSSAPLEFSGAASPTNRPVAFAVAMALLVLA